MIETVMEIYGNSEKHLGRICQPFFWIQEGCFSHLFLPPLVSHWRSKLHLPRLRHLTGLRIKRINGKIQRRKLRNSVPLKWTRKCAICCDQMEIHAISDSRSTHHLVKCMQQLEFLVQQLLRHSAFEQPPSNSKTPGP
jgi:DNA-binding transcriptional regulator YdaS (Cro superfamily)